MPTDEYPKMLYRPGVGEGFVHEGVRVDWHIFATAGDE